MKETESTARRGASKISENTLHRGGGEEGGVHFYSNVINDWYRGVANKNKAHRAWEGGAILDLERQVFFTVGPLSRRVSQLISVYPQRKVSYENEGGIY